MSAVEDAAILEAAIARRRHRDIQERRPEPESRRTGSRVRKNSREAGTTRGVWMDWASCNEANRALNRWERRQAKRPGHRNRGVGYIGLEVFGLLTREAVRRKGRLDHMSYEAIAAILGYARSAIVAAAARLKAHGWLDWVRQWEPTGEQGRRGPQVRQTYNAFWIRIPVAALAKLGIKLGTPTPDDHDHDAKAKAKARDQAELAESPLGPALDRVDRVIAQRETA